MNGRNLGNLCLGHIKAWEFHPCQPRLNVSRSWRWFSVASRMHSEHSRKRVSVARGINNKGNLITSGKDET
jgi:hypothetical protein